MFTFSSVLTSDTYTTVYVRRPLSIGRLARLGYFVRLSGIIFRRVIQRVFFRLHQVYASVSATMKQSGCCAEEQDNQDAGRRRNAGGTQTYIIYFQGENTHELIIARVTER